MNADRRKTLAKLLTQVNDIKSQLETVKDEEQEAFDNMPESLQEGERGQQSQAASDALDSAVQSLEEVESYLEEAQQ